jgi:anti-sigma factor RsiW
MRFLDGELSPEDGRDVERALAAPAVRARADALAQLGGILRARYDLAADEAEERLEAMWEPLRAQVGSRPAQARPSFWGRVRDWIEGYRSHVMTGAVAAAAGALIAIFLTGQTGTRIVYLPRASTQVAAAPADAEVENLEVYGGSGMVFHVPNDDARLGGGTPTTTVIWLSQNDEPDDPVTPDLPVVPTTPEGPI